MDNLHFNLLPLHSSNTLRNGLQQLGGQIDNEAELSEIFNTGDPAD